MKSTELPRFTDKLTVDSGGVKVAGDSEFANAKINGILISPQTHTPSDRRLKRDFSPISSALDKILQIKGWFFRWKKDYHEDQRKKMGVIAQEVRKVFPEAVHEKDDELLVEYQALIAPLIESVKELNRKIEEQKKEIQYLKNRLD